MKTYSRPRPFRTRKSRVKLVNNVALFTGTYSGLVGVCMFIISLVCFSLVKAWEDGGEED